MEHFLGPDFQMAPTWPGTGALVFKLIKLGPEGEPGYQMNPNGTKIRAHQVADIGSGIWWSSLPKVCRFVAPKVSPKGPPRYPNGVHLLPASLETNKTSLE